MKTISIAVKDIAQYVHASGDLHTSSQASLREKIGQELHLYRQSMYEDADQEVTIQGDVFFNDVTFHLRGRMDGLFKQEPLIEEIKSTLLDLSQIEKDTYPNHFLQLKIYMYLYMKQENLTEMKGRLLYIHHPSKATKTFEETYAFETLEFEVETALETYLAWWRILESHRAGKSDRFQMMPFPFESFREGQASFIERTFETMVNEDLLFIEAPTGIGKTAASLHGALKSVRSDTDKLFYVTAKRSGQDAAIKALKKMQDDTPIKTVRLSSKERLCLRDEVDCDPEICPFAKGYYDRIQGALKELYQSTDDVDAEILKKIGLDHKVCPHELALDISLHSDVIVADYNYAFDPRIRLIRFFEDEEKHPKLLIDEAHNLVDRGKSMYSATLDYETITHAKLPLSKIKPSPNQPLNDLHEALDAIISHASKNKEDAVLFASIPAKLMETLDPVLDVLEVLMQRHKFHSTRKTFKDLYFHLLEFKRISEYFNDRFVFEVKPLERSMSVLCLDPSEVLHETLKEKAKGATLFSATLEPFDYYQNLLSKGEGGTLKLPSPFDPRRLGLFVDVSHSLRYKDRMQAIPRITDTLIALYESGPFHMMTYFPSFAFMKEVLKQNPLKKEHCYIQTPGMAPEEKEELFRAFKTPADHPKMLWTVLGGSFSEGIELEDNLLKGVFIIGTALPTVSQLKKLEMHRFNEKYGDGFHYAYTYPGMTKVIQAVGRVIRRLEDTGIAILMDDRYATPIYQSLMPTAWNHAKYLEEDDYIQGYLKAFF